MKYLAIAILAAGLVSFTISKTNTSKLSNKGKVEALLDGFNTGDKTPISYINPNKYIQHNLAVADGLQGFGEVMQHAPEGGFKANVIRSFQDGDFVFTQTKYDFFGPKGGFDIFRFEDGLIVEHWDNLTVITPPNQSGRTQFDGATKITDLDKTEANKKVVSEFLQNVVINHEMDKLPVYINPKKYLQHNPQIADGLDGFGAAMKYFARAVKDHLPLVLLLPTEPLVRPLQSQPEFMKCMTDIFKTSGLNDPTQRYKKMLFKNGELEKYKIRLNELMNEDELFLMPDLSLRLLAEYMNLPPNQMSQLLNQGYDRNFSEFINGYRLSAFINKLKTDKAHQLTLLALAYESGFNSKTVFNTFFKKIEGITPNIFLKSFNRN